MFDEDDFAACMKIIGDFTESTIWFNTKIMEEIGRQGIMYYDAYEKLYDCFCANIYKAATTEQTRKCATAIRNKDPRLHRGDDVILACAMETGSVLVTCDNDLYGVAKQHHSRDVINPNYAFSQEIYRIRNNGSVSKKHNKKRSSGKRRGARQQQQHKTVSAQARRNQKHQSKMQQRTNNTEYSKSVPTELLRLLERQQHKKRRFI